MDFTERELKWQQKWEELGCFKAIDFSPKPKYYALCEFPYPSGVGLHTGHTKAFLAPEVISRKKRLEGYNVLFPIGWDAFGLPTENYAIKNNIAPRIATDININNMRKQLKRIGFSYDYSREIDTTSEEYYKWTQWIFLQLYKNGLAYRDNTLVNYCPKCDCILSNEESQGGTCDRCGTEVVQKQKNVWFLRIRNYAEKLLEGLKDLECNDRVREEQKNWIGKSTGTTLYCSLESGEKFEIFTTCIETVYGITYFVFAPEHKLVEKLKDKIENYDEVLEYIKKTSKKSEFERTELIKEKTGCLLKGIYAINPVNNKKVPVYISDYVLAGYGSGAVMAVPTHDQRDYEFAKKFNIPMIEVISGGDTSEKAFEKADYLGKNCKLINSDRFTGLTVEEAKKEITKFLEENNLGRKETNYKMRDWAFNRQRYWGEPFPIIYCPHCGIVPVPEKDLPVKLPIVDKILPPKDGESPLANIEEWVNCTCPVCGAKSRRETDTMPQWAGSSWYYLRYMDPHNTEAIASKEKLDYWGQVDLYNGGMEHVTRHLIYSRFWNLFLYDIGVVPNKEPYKKRTVIGLVLGEDGEKMSKSLGNTVDPMSVVNEFGADVLRVYVLFMGDYEKAIPWKSKDILGCKRFLDRVSRIDQFLTDKEDVYEEHYSIYNDTVKKVSEDIDEFKFNTAIACLMTYVNEIYNDKKISRQELKTLLTLLYPFAPHLAEEINETNKLGDYICLNSWPKLLNVEVVKNIKLPIQINGKVKAFVDMKENLPKDEVFAIVKENERVKLLLENYEIVKEIYVPNKIINFIIK